MAIRNLGTKRNFPSEDFFFNVLNGATPGMSSLAFGGSNPGLGADNEETITNIRLETGTGGLYPFPLSDITVYVSSTSASDVGLVVVLIGLDDTYSPVTRLGFLNGQTPVVMSGPIFRIQFGVVVTPFAPVGSIYFSTDNTDITNGEPNTLSNVLTKIDAGGKAGFLSSFTIPVGQKGYFFDFAPSSSKAADVDVILAFRFSATEDFQPAPDFQAFQSNSHFNQVMGFILPEKTDVNLTAFSPTQGSRVTASFSGVRIAI